MRALPLLCLLASARLLFAGDGPDPAMDDGPSVGDNAPAFKLTLLDSDRTVRLRDLRGKPTVLFFGSYT